MTALLECAVRVLVTRGTDAAVEVLVHEGPSGISALYGDVLPGEHPTEAAFRVAAAGTGHDVFFTFRKLGESRVGDVVCHIYQTSPEVELPDEMSRPESAYGESRRMFWIGEADARTRLGPELNAALRKLSPG